MIDRDETYTGEILLHRPSEKPKKPKKSKHKHIYEPCVYQLSVKQGIYDTVKEFAPDIVNTIGSYCPICGKVGTIYLREEPWYTDIGIVPGKSPTERALREFKSETRTLPCFELADLWQKEVEL